MTGATLYAGGVFSFIRRERWGLVLLLRRWGYHGGRGSSGGETTGQQLSVFLGLHFIYTTRGDLSFVEGGLFSGISYQDGVLAKVGVTKFLGGILASDDHRDCASVKICICFTSDRFDDLAGRVLKSASDVKRLSTMLVSRLSIVLVCETYTIRGGQRAKGLFTSFFGGIGTRLQLLAKLGLVYTITYASDGYGQVGTYSHGRVGRLLKLYRKDILYICIGHILSANGDAGLTLGGCTIDVDVFGCRLYGDSVLFVKGE